jgi:2-polyprenyl-3-methyl-5-hydroxy-6-metoxy-1,4-benzoquinol methylase
MDKQTQKELLEIVRRNYEEIASDFNETRKKNIWPILSELAEAVKDGDKILDVGCGNGRLLAALAGKKVLYTGLDQSEKLLAFARENYPQGKFELGNLLELSQFNEINFDHVFCLAVLHHLPGSDLRLAALRQLKNKIKDDGRIIVTVWNLWSQPKFRKLITRYGLLKLVKKNKMDIGDILFSGFSGSQRYYHAFTRYELKKIAHQAGLKPEKFYKDEYNYYLVLKK